MGNLNITPFNNAKGSIIWRMNNDNIADCQDLKELAKGEIQYQNLEMEAYGFNL